MSTRATYKFDGGGKGIAGGPTTVYVHYDGYPEGAAVYFWEAMRNESKGCLATQFVRANAEAELTGGHETHGDTEFRYTVEGSSWETATVACEGRDTPKLGGGKWGVVFAGALTAFLEKYPRLLDGFEPFKAVNLGWCRIRRLNAATARKPFDHAYGHLVVWAKTKPFGDRCREAGNWKNCEAEVRTLVAAFPTLAELVDPAVVDLTAA